MKEPRLAIGGLLLPEVAGWAFSERDDAIIGRPARGPGALRILHVPQETMAQPVTHEFCMSVIGMVLMTACPPTDREMKESVTGPYGAATFVRPIRRGRWRGEDELLSKILHSTLIKPHEHMFWLDKAGWAIYQPAIEPDDVREWQNLQQ